MELVSEIKEYYSKKRTAVALGKFNGFHRGHRALLNKIMEYSCNEINSVLYVFDINEKSLLTKEEMLDYLGDSVDTLIICSLEDFIKKMSGQTFVEEVLVKRLSAKYIVVGEDFRFGHNREGDVSVLRKYSQQYDYYVDVVPKVMYEDKAISSSYIKKVLERGEVHLANSLLGHDYKISGVVVDGHKLGRTIGFPTINLVPPCSKILPLLGVYGCSVFIDDKVYKGICNIGEKPTVTKETKPVVESHIFDFDGDAYGKKASVKPLFLVRPEKKFNTIEELKIQIGRDIEVVKGSFWL